MNNTPMISGWFHTPFGKFADPDPEALITRATRGALAHAGIAPDEVDGIFLGTMNNGLCKQDFQAGLVGLVDPALAQVPAVRCENACASGSAALHAALDFLQAGRGRIALVIGVEVMNALPTSEIGDILLGASYRREEAGPAGFAGVFSSVAREYFRRYGDRSEELALIAARNHRNGVHNPYAHVRRDLGFAFCNTVSEKNPYVAEPLRRTDCSMISDGAAALVLAHPDVAMQMPRAIAFRARTQANDYLPLSRRDPTAFDGAARAWRQAMDEARVSLDDLHLVETHDCFTIAELLEYEAMGLTPRGEGHRAIREGWTEKDGRLPINPSGGLKSRGHPVGATGISMHVMACLQLMNEAEQMQIPDASLVGVFNMGGAAVANYVSILERAR